ncbi:MAG: phosphate--acyl-ACP acyltransferase, partial [Eubacteriales bacterium]|nr:phosphate--acyl-ACP acyltransferase [Eubacteriales bacterium]
MKIVLDGMGGDHAPAEIVKGAVMAAGMIKHDIYIVGKKDAIEAELKKNKFKGKNIKIVDAAEVITMDDSPVKAIRRKTESSMVVGLNMVRDGYGDIFISG